MTSPVMSPKRSRRRSSVTILRSEYSDQIIKSNNLAENKLAIEAKHFEKAKKQTCKSIENEQQALQTALEQSNKRRMSLPLIRVETAKERLLADQSKLFEKCHFFLEDTKRFTSSEKLPTTAEETDNTDEDDLKLNLSGSEESIAKTGMIKGSDNLRTNVDGETIPNQGKSPTKNTLMASNLSLRPSSSPDKPSKNLLSPNRISKDTLSKGPLTSSTSNINREMTLNVPKMTTSRSAEHLVSMGRADSPFPTRGIGKLHLRRFSDEERPKSGSMVQLPSIPSKKSLTGQKN